MTVLTPRAKDFPRWYQDVVAKAEMAENGPVRGTIVIRPYGYAIWELMQADVDKRIKSAGAQNCYFPLLIPESYLHKEAEHVEGFSPELAVVTHGGGKVLEEPAVVRPTSETVIGNYMAKWIQSYRDLPLLLNQWANVVRWELRPRLFLRTSEFLWQEGHTAHESQADAAAYARRIHLEVYRDFLSSQLAIPVLVGLKTKKERFAGAINTMTCEGMMGDGKALQMATSHELGQNFSRSFDIHFDDAERQRQLVWTTSWGSSTRMVGGLIMAHGDDKGLRLPPKIAPVQAVILPVREDDDLLDASKSIADTLAAAGVRSKVDMQSGWSFGRRATEWEVRGAPVRVEVGPRDLAAGLVTIARRDLNSKVTVALEKVGETVVALLEEIQAALYAQALETREARTKDVETLDEALEAGADGFARLPWAAVGEEGERLLGKSAITVRCLQRPDGTMPDSIDEPGLICIAARSY